MRTVLIIEDAPQIAKPLCAGLLEAGFQCQLATTAEEAIEAMAKIGRPCIVLIDALMPSLRSWDVVALLEPDDVLATIPVRIVGGERALKETYALEALLSIVRSHCEHALA